MSDAGFSSMSGAGAQDIPFQEQNKPLLQTKLFIPPIRTDRVSRTHLLEKLTTSQDKPLILVSAPAGYGKTTLASSWLQSVKTASSWLSLDEADNDPIIFLQDLTAALRIMLPSFSIDLSSALHGLQPEVFQPLMNLLINTLSQSEIAFTLVLDDVHAVHSQPVLDILTYLVEHLPPGMHLMLLTRTDPPLPLARLRARNQLVELRAEQLRFTCEEVSSFLNGIMGLHLSMDEVAAMEKRTEGWVAGLHLAALSMQGRQDASSFVSAFTGSHLYIVDYLTDEVLQRQTEEVRSFLLRTSILNRMCGPLCEAVCPSPLQIPGSGQAMLETIEGLNLFLIPLDDQRHWYRYHHLFADMLIRRLERADPTLVPDLHRQASLWYEQNGILLEAIGHSLAAEDKQRAALLVADNGCNLLMRGEGFTLLKMIDAVQSFAQMHPWLAALKAWALALTGHLDEVELALQRSESLIPANIEMTFEIKVMLGTIASIRAHLSNELGESLSAAEHARKALELLPADNDFSCSLRGVAVSILGEATRMNGDLTASRQAYLQARQIGQAARNPYMELIANSSLADVMMEQGELHQAARIYSDCLRVAVPPDGQILPLAMSAYMGMGKIAYEWNRLEEAAQYFRAVIELSQQWSDFFMLARGYLLLARLERVRGNSLQAGEAFQAGERVFHSQTFTDLQSTWLYCMLGNGWLTEGKPEKAASIWKMLGISSESMMSLAETRMQQEPVPFFLLRLLLAQGDYAGALAIIEHLLPVAKKVQQNRRLIELLILQALAFQGEKHPVQALNTVVRALSLAQPEGFTRMFLDFGEPLVKLLYQVKSHQMNGYASELLEAWGKPAGEEHKLPAQTLIEALTQREIEVLNLIKDGASNQEIADRLVISLPTVKRHISNIYTKLGAKSRTQAVSLGRELGLIE